MSFTAVRSAGATYGRASERSQPTEPELRRHRPDYILVVIVALLIAIGLTVVYAISPALSVTGGGSGGHYVSRQILAIALSVIAFFVTARIPLKTWRHWQKPLLIVAGVGTLIALATPVNVLYPAHRWIRFGGFSLQSVEILKFALVIALASFFALRIQRNEIASWERTFKPL